jgi:hypothetical protein
MKVKKILCLFYIFSQIALAQNPINNIRWAKVLSSDFVYGNTDLMQTDNEGNLVLLETFVGNIKLDHSIIIPNSGLSNVILKFDSTGNLLFSKVIGQGSNKRGLAVDNMNNIYASYYSNSNSTTTIIEKLNSNGSFIWKDSVINNNGGPNWYLNVLTAGNNGEIYYTDQMGSSFPVYFNTDSIFFLDSTKVSFMLLKINSTGNLSKAAVFYSKDTNAIGITGPEVDAFKFNKIANELFISGDETLGRLILGNDTIGELTNFIFRMDTSFNLLNKYLYSLSSNGIRNISFDQNNNVYTSGNYSGGMDVIEQDTCRTYPSGGFIIKFDQNLTHQWHRFVVNNSQIVNINSSSSNSEGNFFLTTEHQSDSVILKFDKNGNLRWRLAFPNQHTGNDQFLVSCNSNQLFGDIRMFGPLTIKGTTYTPDSSSFLLFEMTDPDSLNSVTIINSDIFNIFPNPATNQLHLTLNKNIKDGEVNIFNVMGEKVYADLITGNEKTINYRLAAGVYFVRVTSEERVWVEKLVVE